MKTNSQPIWPSLITTVTFIMVLMLSACGGSPGGSPDVTSSPTALLEGATQGAGSSPIGSPVVIGYDDGSVYRFSGNTNNSLPEFQDLANVPSPNSSVKLMANYEYNGQQYLMVAEGNNDLYQWNGSSWQNHKITDAQSGAVAVTQMVSYKNGVVVGLADGEVWQLLNNSWTRLHDWGFDSPVAQMAVNGNSVAIVLGDGAIFQMNANDTTTCAKSQGPCWTDLKSPANGVAVTHLISYVDNSNHPMLAIALNNGAVYINSGTTAWPIVGSDGSAKVTQMLAYADPNSLGQNSFLIAYSDGKIFNFISDKGLVQVMALSNPVPITQLAAYKGSFMVGFQSSLYQVTFTELGFVSIVSANPGAAWGADLTQMVVVNNELVVSLSNGAVKEWDGNVNFIWNDVDYKDFSKQSLSLIAPYGDHLAIGLVTGAIVQWNGAGDVEYAELHNDGWGSSVVRIVNWNNAPAVALANGAVEALQNGTTWNERQSPGGTIPCSGLSGYTAQEVQLVSFADRDELIAGLSAGDDSLSTTYSASVIKNLNTGDLVPESDICAGGHNESENAYKDKITQMIAYDNLVLAGYADGGTVRAWDGFSSDSLYQLHDAGWTSPVSTMSVINDKLIVGLGNGAIEQWNGGSNNLKDTSWTELHDSGLGSAASQILEYNDALVALFANSVVLQNTGGNSWKTLEIPLNQPVTNIAIFKGALIAAAADGTLLQYNNSLSIWSVFPSAVVNSAVNQIVDNGNLIVGYANGSFAQWDGTTWTVITPHGGHAITQMMVQ